MRTINCWNDLRPYGLDCLTGEACGLMYRILFDCTEDGRKIIGKWLGIPCIALEEPWNRGSPDDPHVGSIMLSGEAMLPIGIFALLETGCRKVLMYERLLVGLESGDDEEDVARRFQGQKLLRSFAYRGTAGDRNIHVMTGRVS